MCCRLHDLALKIKLGELEDLENIVKRSMESGFSAKDITLQVIVPILEAAKEDLKSRKVSIAELINLVTNVVACIDLLQSFDKNVLNLQVMERQQKISDYLVDVLIDLWKSAGFVERTKISETIDKPAIWGTYKIIKKDDYLVFEVYYCPHRRIRIKLFKL